MTRTFAWIGIGAVGTILMTAAGARLAPAHVIPDLALVCLAFVALRREPIPVVVTALTLGYLVGRQAVAPIGAHETAASVCAIGMYLLSGQLAGSGAFFFALLAGLGTIAYHALLFVLLYGLRDTAGFSSWATAALIPAGAATALVALLAYLPMLWLDTKLAAERREGLGWS